MNSQIIIAGFGGQGILFSGKFLAYAGLIDGYEVAWLPSYGPEMRGGTANCNVVISDEPVGSPIITEATALIVMNAPSFDKFKNTVISGGTIVMDSSLISAKCDRSDVKVSYIPATTLAMENGIAKLANIIMAGKYLKETGDFSPETVEKAMQKCIPPAKSEMMSLNMKALQLGMNYS